MITGLARLAPSAISTCWFSWGAGCQESVPEGREAIRRKTGHPRKPTVYLSREGVTSQLMLAFYTDIVCPCLAPTGVEGQPRTASNH